MSGQETTTAVDVIELQPAPGEPGSPFQLWKVGDKDKAEGPPPKRGPKGRIRSLPDAIPQNLAQDRDPWERQPGEGGQAYAGFIAYRDLGALDRSIKKTAEVLGKGRTNCQRWSSRWHWTERAELWDDAQRRLIDNTVQQNREKSITSHHNASRALLGQALRLLQIEQGKPDPNGRTIQQAAIAIDKAIRHQRISLGLPSDIRQEDVEVKSQIAESLRLQNQVRIIIDEKLCESCRQRVGVEIATLAQHQRKLAKRVGV